MWSATAAAAAADAVVVVVVMKPARPGAVFDRARARQVAHAAATPLPWSSSITSSSAQLEQLPEDRIDDRSACEMRLLEEARGHRRMSQRAPVRTSRGERASHTLRVVRASRMPLAPPTGSWPRQPPPSANHRAMRPCRSVLRDSVHSMCHRGPEGLQGSFPTATS